MLYRQTAFMVAPKSRIDLEVIAEGFLHQLYPENLIKPTFLDVRRMMDRLEVELEVGFGVEDLEPGIEGKTDPERREIIIDTNVYTGVLRGDGRARHTFAHEVGHIPHIGQVNSVITHGGPQLARRLNVTAPVFQDPEWQAHGIGGALLMPRSTAPDVYRRGGFSAMMRTFGVSLRAAQTRIIVLSKQGLIQ